MEFGEGTSIFWEQVQTVGANQQWLQAATERELRQHLRDQLGHEVDSSLELFHQVLMVEGFNAVNVAGEIAWRLEDNLLQGREKIIEAFGFFALDLSVEEELPRAVIIFIDKLSENRRTTATELPALRLAVYFTNNSFHKEHNQYIRIPEPIDTDRTVSVTL